MPRQLVRDGGRGWMSYQSTAATAASISVDSLMSAREKNKQEKFRFYGRIQKLDREERQVGLHAYNYPFHSLFERFLGNDSHDTVPIGRFINISLQMKNLCICDIKDARKSLVKIKAYKSVYTR